MKKILSIIFASIMIISISSCEKKEIISDASSLGVGSYLTLVQTIKTQIDYANLAGSTVSIKVQEYGSAIDKIKLYVTKGTVNSDRTTWKYIKDVPYSGETILAVTAAQIATALGLPVITDLEPGATYTIYNQIVTKDGRIFDASNTNSGFQGLSAYNMAMTWASVIVCPFTLSAVTGNYRVIRDDWADWSVGDIVQVTSAGTNQVNLSQVWPNAAYGSVVNPLLVSVDLATGTATVPKINFGNYGGGYNMTAIGANSTAGLAGFVFTCTGSISLAMILKGDGPGGNGANFGTNTLILKKL